MIIERPKETKRIKELRKWVLIYGRRKTGKTFIVTNFIKHDEYFFVKTNKNIITKGNESISYETFIKLFVKALEESKTVVVDEFHRLGNEFFDFLHFTKKQGKLILISSTLFLSRKLISSKSALLGLFAEVPIGLISLKDTLGSLEKFSIPKKEKLELAMLLREPIAIDYFDEKKKASDIISEIILGSVRAIPALIGEIFTEEEREISAVYEGILRGIAVGKINSGKLSSYLFSKKLIKKDDPSIIQQYLNNLIFFGVIKRIGVFNKKRFVYKLASPLAKMYYYIDEKYNLSERAATNEELTRIINEVIPRIIEDGIREFLAEKYGLVESVIEAEDYDIDACLLKFKKPEVVIEVKWKHISKKDVIASEETLKKINAPKKFLFVQDKGDVHSSLKTMDVGDLI